MSDPAAKSVAAAPISLSDLSAIERAMAPASEYGADAIGNDAGIPLADLRIPAGPAGAVVVEVPVADAIGVVAARAALPVLLEIAATALVLDLALRRAARLRHARARSLDCDDPGADAVRDMLRQAERELDGRRDLHRAALARVRP